MRSVQDLGDELYALPPAAFTAARDAFVGQARERGDRAAATELAGMKRPTQGAWLVNLLALRQPAAVAELIDLGEEIRAAQGTVPPTQLRDLSARRRRALDAALAACTTLATEAGESAPTRAQLGEVETTLAAAMADEAAAEVVRAGRVIKALRYSGFGDGFGATAPAKSGGAPPAARAVAPGGRAGSRRRGSGPAADGGAAAGGGAATGGGATTPGRSGAGTGRGRGCRARRQRRGGPGHRGDRPAARAPRGGAAGTRARPDRLGSPPNAPTSRPSAGCAGKADRCERNAC